jgi:transposase
MGSQRRRFSPEFRRDAVALFRSSGRSIASVAKELGIGESSLGGWLAKDRAQRASADPVGYAAEVVGFPPLTGHVGYAAWSAWG